MLSIKGAIRDGVIQPAEPIEGRDGQDVIITFLDESNVEAPSVSDEDWDALMQLIEDSRMETGIGDLAHQHDHYLYGTPKKES